jgi:hypothetical protein
MRSGRRAAIALSCIVLALSVAACGQDQPSTGDAARQEGSTAAGGGTDGAGGQERKAYEEGLVKYARCMRENGVDMPDPKPGEAIAANRSDPTTQKAMDACRDLLPVNPDMGSPEEFHQNQVKLAKCLRGKGFDIPDPKPGQGLSLPLADGEKLVQAVRECNSTTKQ